MFKYSGIVCLNTVSSNVERRGIGRELKFKCAVMYFCAMQVKTTVKQYFIIELRGACLTGVLLILLL